jgi:hypothetical protein
VEVTFEFHSESESFNVIAGVVGFARTSGPEVEADFTVLVNADEVVGWKHYVNSVTLDTGSKEKAWVAVGLTALWETEMTYNMDNVEITLS